MANIKIHIEDSNIFGKGDWVFSVTDILTNINRIILANDHSEAKEEFCKETKCYPYNVLVHLIGLVNN